MFVFHVTPPCVLNSHFHFWATGESARWTGWSWRPYTSLSALLRLGPSPVLEAGVEYCSGPGWASPDPGGACGWLVGGWRPWRRGSGWAAIFPSLPVRTPRPGASSPVWTAPRRFWERPGSPRRPQGWGTSPDSGGGREGEKAMCEGGKDGWIWRQLKRDRWQKWQVEGKKTLWSYKESRIRKRFSTQISVYEPCWWDILMQKYIYTFIVQHKKGNVNEFSRYFFV